jgi:hypothetical protein
MKPMRPPGDGRLVAERIRATLAIVCLLLFALSPLYTVRAREAWANLMVAHGLAAVAIVLTAVTGIGYLAARPLTASLSRGEGLAWSMVIGLLILVSLCVAMLAARLQPGPKKLAAAGLLVAALSLLVRRRRVPSQDRRPRSASVELLRAFSFVVVFLFAVAATRTPMWGTDYESIWGLKARAIFTTASIPDRLFHDPSIAGSNPTYPLLVPLLLSSLAASVAEWDGRALALLYPFLQSGTVLLTSGFIGRRISPLAGAPPRGFSWLSACLSTP